MKKSISNLQASIHDRLMNEAQKLDIPFNHLLQYFAIERFLYRMSKSKYHSQFILKGGLVFQGWNLPLRRLTRDIDLRGYIENSLENIAFVIQEICLQEVEPDGLIFDAKSISVRMTQVDADYQGARVTLTCTMGKARIPIQIDIGFSDKITPAPLNITYPVLLRNFDHPLLKGYPRETVIAEKFHAMVYLDAENSRIKDLIDIWNLASNFNFDGKVLRKAIIATFNQRSTNLPGSMPFALSDEFSSKHALRWEPYCSDLGKEIGKKIAAPEIMGLLRTFFAPLIDSLSKTEFNQQWIAGIGWVNH